MKKNKEEKNIEKQEITVPIKKNFWKSSLSFSLEIAKTIIISLAIIIPIRYFLVQPFLVDGASMQPNFYDNEYLIVDEISYRFNEPKRGEVIVFKNPEKKSQYFIKRIIGLPSETIKIEDGYIYIKKIDDGEFVKIDETNYLPEDTKTLGFSRTLKLQNDEYFVLGDNRANSKDSRILGPIQESLISGRAWIRGFPFNKITIFKYPDCDY